MLNTFHCNKNALRNATVEIVVSEQLSRKVAWFLKEHYCPARNHTTLHDYVLSLTFSTLQSSFAFFTTFHFVEKIGNLSPFC